MLVKEHLQHGVDDMHSWHGHAVLYVQHFYLAIELAVDPYLIFFRSIGLCADVISHSLSSTANVATLTSLSAFVLFTVCLTDSLVIALVDGASSSEDLLVRLVFAESLDLLEGLLVLLSSIELSGPLTYIHSQTC